ncbi:response regulator [Pseudonocardia abyssalis]|jgi:response regulator of citrate/malate metabolism|uniref:Transcriptional regulatory protein n=1 Tax=Pseudonocardia abyssalis TaxID=2792008 RepID=A0ABS6UVX0_9PSEU|nr:response regulator [Pseudonocardia abyssalis]MBW0118109.1 response regulator [Pseudonocardia abyssalis]MBW0136106.1 response regulator [Pseudonocardia abyssalis]
MNDDGPVIRTLVVDDDPIALDAHVAYVERVRGFAVVGRAATGTAALRALAIRPVDLVLLDVHLPDMSGLDVLRRMRAAGHACDVIMVTRSRDLEVVRAAVAFGATQYLMKPFPAGVVRAKLEGYLAYRETDPGPLVAQSDVDGLLDALRAPSVESGLPKGISRESLEQVAGVLGPDAGRTAVEVADLVGVSRVTARRYLEHLADTGLAERTLRYGSTGRPQVEYTWRPHGGT